jgi:hypothetical protein
VTLTRLQALTRQHRTHLSAEASFLMGRMAERHAAAATRGRDDFAKRYPKLRKRWKRLRLRLDRIDSRARQPAESTLPPGSDERTS